MGNKPFSLPAYCTQHKLSYKDLAATLGISASYACQLRRGTMPMTLGIARRMSAKLGISLDVMLNSHGGGTVVMQEAGQKGKKR